MSRKSSTSVYEFVARAIEAEGVRMHFALIGNGNMFVTHALDAGGFVRTLHARHEHAAVAMAEGHARKTGDVGFSSVTCGAGFTQIMTALTTAARASVPLVVLAGEAPVSPNFHIHRVNQSMLTAATGAHFVGCTSMRRLPHDICEAFYVARRERRPVVLSIPEDMQLETYSGTAYEPSTTRLPQLEPLPPGPVTLERIAAMLAKAQCPVLLAGRGAVRSGAGAAIRVLAERTGALLSTSLMAKGLFDGHSLSVGTSGGFATPKAREALQGADLVISFGARMGYFTTDGGSLLRDAAVAMVDIDPQGFWEGDAVGQVHLRADARLAAEALAAAVPQDAGRAEAMRALAAEVARSPIDDREFAIPDGTVDPRCIMAELDAAVPRDWDVVCGGSHFFYFALSYLANRPPEKLHVVNEFGAIGSALPAAIGIAAERGDGQVLLIEGDGSLLMHAQELETIARHGIRLVICAVNDGGYASEFHKFRMKGMDDSSAVHGRADLAKIARGFGLDGATFEATGRLAGALADYGTTSRAALWDLHVADIPARQFAEVNMKLYPPPEG